MAFYGNKNEREFSSDSRDSVKQMDSDDGFGSHDHHAKLSHPRYGRRSGGMRVSDGGGEEVVDGSIVGGVSSEQLNRTRMGRRRFDENSGNGNRIY